MTTSIHSPARTAAGPTLRVLVTIGALVVALQAVLAGMVLSGDSGALMLHSIVGSLAVLIGLVQLVAAGVARFRGRAGTAMVTASGILFVALLAQFAVGTMTVLAVHVPLGVLIFGCYAVLLVTVWRR